MHAKVLARENVSNGKSIALKTATIMTEFDIPAKHVVVDNFGVGVDCIQELAML